MLKVCRYGKANIDIQPAPNHYKAVTYMCAYFSKAKNETFKAMKQAAKEAGMSGKTELGKMRTIAKAYSKKREYLVQEAVYLLMPELWLRKRFPRVIFLKVMSQKNVTECFVVKKIWRVSQGIVQIFLNVTCLIDI